MLHELRVRLKPLVPTRLHGAAKAVASRIARLWLSGSRVLCPCCGRRFRRFLRYPAPALYCPGCSSYERHRFLWLVLERRSELLGGRSSVLHVAPEPSIQRALARAGIDDYLSIDLEYRLAMQRMDVTDLDLADDRFDLVLCSHVLELVPERQRAVSELHRVLKPGGVALFQFQVEAQDELAAELADAGFDVSALVAEEELDAQLLVRCGLIAEEKIYVSTKPARAS